MADATGAAMPSKFHEPLPEPDNEVEVFVEPDEPQPDPPAPPRRRAEDWEPKTKHHDVHVQMPPNSEMLGLPPWARFIFQGGAAAVVLALYITDQREKSAQAREAYMANATQIREMQGFISRRSDEDRALFREEQAKQREHDSKERDATRMIYQASIAGINSAVAAIQATQQQNAQLSANLAEVVKTLKTFTPVKPRPGPSSMGPEAAPMPKAAGDEADT